MFDRLRRRRQVRRVRPGDGSALKTLHLWQLLHRSQFDIDLEEPAGDPHRFTVDVHHAADEIDDEGRTEEPGQAPPVALYRDGIQVHRANPPAAFPAPGGHIEVARNLYGMTRMHFVPADGTPRTLTPNPRSFEGWRARFGRRFPGASRVLGIVAVVVLLVGLVVTVPQLLELVTRIDIVAEEVGSFTSPITLPTWGNASLLIASMLAATERALTLRNHWLIDADTTWTSFS